VSNLREKKKNGSKVKRRRKREKRGGIINREEKGHTYKVIKGKKGLLRKGRSLEKKVHYVQ